MPVVADLNEARTLARVRHYAGEGSVRLYAQQKRVQPLRVIGADTGAARSSSETFEDLQLLLFAHLRQLERRSRR